MFLQTNLVFEGLSKKNGNSNCYPLIFLSKIEI